MNFSRQRADFIGSLQNLNENVDFNDLDENVVEEIVIVPDEPNPHETPEWLAFCKANGI
jgi:hypothetical protein